MRSPKPEDSSANQLNFIVATAGHVDHGKSALVKALTGIDPDRLPEEKERGITIDLGFAHLLLAGSRAGAPREFRVGIVDVPGHEDFVKNMVAGVGSIDLALFVVAADDGWMPQTEEHLQILSYLGIRHAVVALTKSDLIPDNPQPVLSEIGFRLKDSPFSEARIIPTSVLTGAGLDQLKGALVEVLAGMPLPRDMAKPRLPIDRVFSLKGMGRIVTGSLTGGSLQPGQSVVLQPSGRVSRIRAVQSHNREIQVSGPGMRTALNLTEPGGGEGLNRGEVVTLSELGAAQRTMDVLLEKSVRLTHDPQDKRTNAPVSEHPASTRAASRPLKDATRVRIHHGSANFPARILFCEQRELLPGQKAIAQLRLETPAFCFVGDRFIVRDWGERATLAGGIVLDPDAEKNRFRHPDHQAFLKQRAQAPEDLATLLITQLKRDRAIRKTDLLIKSSFSAHEIDEQLGKLVVERKIVGLGSWVVDAGFWETLKQSAVEAIDGAHRLHPEQPGLALHQLRSGLLTLLPAPDLFELLVGHLCEGGFVQAGAAIRRRTHRPALPPELQAAGAAVLTALSSKPLEPPSRKELAPDPTTQKAVRFLIDSAAAVELGGEIVLLADQYKRATELIRKHLAQHGSATVSELRTMVGTSRRILVPLLERMDREGYTVREGDKRRLGRRSLS